MKDVKTITRPTRITAEQFISIWNKAESTEEAAGSLGMNLRSATARASQYRAHGVSMKRMSAGRKLDWKRLAEFSKKTMPDA